MKLVASQQVIHCLI